MAFSLQSKRPDLKGSCVIKIGITGADGLIGWHLCSFLHSRKDITVTTAGFPEFGSGESLARFAAPCDVIVHLAGMNRGDDAEVAKTNIALTEALIGACKSSGAKPHIIFSSSTHIYRDTPYGNSKKACTELLKAWAAQSGGKFTNLILPNIFGESGKPFYNSAVSTFCFQLANGQEPKIIEDNEIEILHAQRVAREILSIATRSTGGESVLKGSRLAVSQLLSKLRNMANLYSKHIIPDIRTPEDLDLFNTYRSYLFPQKYPVSLEMRKDARGTLFEAVKGLNGGQTFISATKPGITRGNHYHTLKVERFLVIKGKAIIRIRKLFSGETKEFAVDGAAPAYIDIPALHTHNITNTGKDELMTLFWANEIFDPDNPDTYQETV